MNARTYLFIVLLVTLTACVGGTPPVSQSDQSYVEPSLWTVEANSLTVIVTAEDSQQAAKLVEQAGGRVVSDLWLIDAVSATVPADRLETLAAQSGVVSIVVDKQVRSADEPLWDGWAASYDVPVPYDGSADAVPTNDPTVWELVNPISIDVGADVLHNDHNITGKGVGVAVIDSGIFFEPSIKNAFSHHISQHFFGQVDFVGDGLCSDVTGMQQYDGYCFANKDYSHDGYGHGSHIAGIIWNNITDQDTGVYLGIAPEAEVLSVRVLGADGTGTYTDVIEGIQYVVQNKYTWNIRVMNLSLSAYATVPYFEDPLDRAVEEAWAAGIVVVAAAGNTGPGAESITVPGNDPYVISVGSINNQRTPGYWGDDIIPAWQATGPTWDGFAKPDVLAPGNYVISFMYSDPDDMSNSDLLVQQHPDNVVATTMFRMSGTSQATAVTSGVVALMIDADQELTPDQVKYRLMVSARPALTGEDGAEDLVYNILQQGMGRIWAPEAALGDFPADNYANYGMDINADLAHDTGWVDLNGDGWVTEDELDPAEMAYHYGGRIGRMTSDDGQAYLYYMLDDSADSIKTVRDEFNSVSYSNNDGTALWQGDWLENDDGLPGSGYITVTENRLQIRGSGMVAQRAADLSLTSSASLNFDFISIDNGNDYFEVWVSDDAGATFTQLELIPPTGSGQTVSKSYQLENYITFTPDVIVRFEVAQGFAGPGQFASVDNVRIEYDGGGGTVVATVRDEFDATSFMGNDGSESWLDDWTEINESDGPGYGDVAIVTDLDDTRLQIKDNDGGGEGVQRQADLSNVSSATLSFEYSRYGPDDYYDYVAVQISADGGSSWTELDRFAGPGDDYSYIPVSYDISAYSTANTAIRFISSPWLGYSDQIFFDNVQIEYQRDDIGGPTSATSSSVDVQVSQSSDDAEECLSDGYTLYTSSDLEMVNAFDQVWTDGIRFQNVTVPQD